MKDGSYSETHPLPPVLSGLAEVCDSYDAFLIDSYGVLHDGATLFPESEPTLRALQGLGKTTLILTNTPRRAAVVSQEIARLGVLPELHQGVVSAGELTWRKLQDPISAIGIEPGARFFYVGPERSRGLLDGVPLDESLTLKDADLLIILGLYPSQESISDYHTLLEEACRRNLPAVCGNPDRLAVRAGIAGPAAGAIAVAYEALGGRVHSFGKPFAGIYEMAMERLPGVHPSRVLAVGDALFTDVMGAVGAGLDTAFVANGIHQTEIDMLGLDRLGSLFRREGVFPSYTIPRFTMGEAMDARL